MRTVGSDEQKRTLVGKTEVLKQERRRFVEELEIRDFKMSDSFPIEFTIQKVLQKRTVKVHVLTRGG